MRRPPPNVEESWPAPNYTNPVRRGRALIIVEVIITTIMIAVFLLRLYVRVFRVKKAWWDDLLMIPAAICGVGVTVCTVLASAEYGWDIHAWDLPPGMAVKGRKVSLAAQTLFIFASGLAKNSILVSYLRIAPADSWFRRLTRWATGLVTLLIVAFLIVLWTQCNPISGYWDWIGGPECIREEPPVLAQSITSVLTDFLVYVLPLPTLYSLRLPRPQRIGLILTFSLGFVVVVAGCMRTYWSHYVSGETYDVTWYGWRMWIWTAVEANLGVICGCLPTLRPMVLYWRRTGSGGDGGGSGQAVMPRLRTIEEDFRTPEDGGGSGGGSDHRGSSGRRLVDEDVDGPMVTVDLEMGEMSGKEGEAETPDALAEKDCWSWLKHSDTHVWRPVR